MDDPEIPSFFICPISLQIMKDPVTISTGMTFDRDSIQKWFFSYKNTTCPITKQPLSDFILIPNSNLLRLIQSWQLLKLNTSSTNFVDQKQPDEDSLIHLKVILEEIKQPHLQARSLREIKSLLRENDGHGNFISTRDHDCLFSLVAESILVKSELQEASDTSMIVNDAVSVLCLLKPSHENLKKVSEEDNGRFIKSLSLIMTQSVSQQARVQAALLLTSLFKVVDNIYKESLEAEFFDSMIEILKDQNSKHGTTAVLSILVEVLAFGKNNEKAIKGGFVPVLVELLAESKERRVCEMMLVVLEKLCRKAEGRAAFIAHPLGISAVLSKMLRVSHVGNDKAIALLLWVFRFCWNSEVEQEFVEVGGMATICMLVQSGCSSKAKDKAREILWFHQKKWKKSPCFSTSFII